MIASWSWPERLIAGLIVCIGLGVRVALSMPILVGSAPIPDHDGYLSLADSLVSGEGYRAAGRLTAYRPPLYPITLMPGLILFGKPAAAWVIAMNWVFGLATILVTGLAAWRWGIDRRGVLVAMFVVGVDPVLVAQSKSLMTETLATLLVGGLFCCAGGSNPTIRTALWTGVVGGLGGLCRPSLLPAALLITCTTWRGSGSTPRRFIRVAMGIGALIAILSSWAIRNMIVFGEPVWTTTHGGYTLLLANNEVYYDEVLNGPLEVWSGPQQADWFRSVNRLAQGISEPESDRLYRSMALELARERPFDFLRASLERLGRFWALAPSESVYSLKLRIATALWTLPLWVLVIRGLLRRSLSNGLRAATLALIVSLSAVHTIYWTDLRMRAPAVPGFALLAGSAISRRLGHGPGSIA